VTGQWRSSKVRRPREVVYPYLQILIEELADDNPGLEYYVGGSWRRGAQVIGDIDLLVISDEPLTASLFEPGVILPSCVTWQRRGPRIANGDLWLPDGPLHVDVWQAPPASRGAMLAFITGPQQLVILQRRRARAMNLALSQNALADRSTGQPLPGTDTERGIYAVLGMPFLSPQERQKYVR
jgi:DNA polymerase/3'-5' exonuclease PolX